jgi:hypothetical protein
MQMLAEYDHERGGVLSITYILAEDMALGGLS